VELVGDLGLPSVMGPAMPEKGLQDERRRVSYLI
jgi:hypothetical protein